MSGPQWFEGLYLGLLVTIPLVAAAHSNVWRVQRPSSAAVAIATLLRHDLDGWERGRHEWRHLASGITLWVANEDYGLEWWLSGRRGMKPPKADRRHVWRTLRPILEHTTQDIAKLALESLRTAPIRGAATVVHMPTRTWLA